MCSCKRNKIEVRKRGVTARFKTRVCLSQEHVYAKRTVLLPRKVFLKPWLCNSVSLEDNKQGFLVSLQLIQTSCLYAWTILMLVMLVSQDQTCVQGPSTAGDAGMTLLPTQLHSFLARRLCRDFVRIEWLSKTVLKMGLGLGILSPTGHGLTTRLALIRTTCPFGRKSTIYTSVDTPSQSLPFLFLLPSSSLSRESTTLLSLRLQQRYSD